MTTNTSSPTIAGMTPLMRGLLMTLALFVAIFGALYASNRYEDHLDRVAAEEKKPLYERSEHWVEYEDIYSDINKMKSLGWEVVHQYDISGKRKIIYQRKTR